MRIRAADPADFTHLPEIERSAGECFRDIGMPEIADDDLPTPEELARYPFAWVAVLTDPVAYLVAAPVDGGLHIEQVSVHASVARRGIGRALIEEAARAGHPALTLTTFAEVPWNAPYYERCGFVRLGADELSPGLRRIREEEAARGLDRWPRVTMRRPAAPPR
ncbi:GNAT family N-acetyltransferase [Amycolatopsis endophytica]|uniref:GNAT superfamily N-acetyltransferase n=1 Tax=Amycolatopsis endophytica TaxID=860233 RepID=A0A853B3R5_9PSEU|nr:GNAT family N-acetyltransferase [Amycolatopsis endophytica]NYI89803.1 GNAT superfamily N-acetyltransferase [Amycolatopsis endophytica]